MLLFLVSAVVLHECAILSSSQGMSLSRELDELRDQLADSERIRKGQLAELEDVMSSKDDVGKNVSEGEGYNLTCKMEPFKIFFPPGNISPFIKLEISVWYASDMI